VEKLRKILEVTFALLSIFFAVIALARFFHKSDDSQEKYKPLPPAKSDIKWGSQMLSESRRTTRLVLFNVDEKDNADEFFQNILDLKNDTQLEELLRDNYITVTLNRHAWPADFAVFDCLLYAKNNKQMMLKYGILSPRMRPIFLSPHTKDSSKNDDTFRPLAIAAAQQFRENKHKMLKESLNSVRIIYNPENFKSTTIEAPYIPRLSFLNAESVALLSYFSNPNNNNAPAGVFTENARLAMRISATDLRQVAAQRAAFLAARTMFARLNNPNSEFSEKLLMARALAEYGMCINDNALIENLKKFANKIIENKTPEGLFREGNNLPLVRHNAIAVGFLTRLYFSTDEKKFYNAAKTSMDNLAEMAKVYGEMPAIADKSVPSQASSIEYGLLARALCDMHYASKDKKYLDLIKKCMEEWNDFYMTPIGIWSINSENSISSNYARPIIMDDTRYPSYVGLASQVMAYLNQNDPFYRLPNGAKIRRIAASAYTYSMLGTSTNASLKLSFFMFKNKESPAAVAMPKVYYNYDLYDIDEDNTNSKNDKKTSNYNRRNFPIY